MERTEARSLEPTLEPTLEQKLEQVWRDLTTEEEEEEPPAAAKATELVARTYKFTVKDPATSENVELSLSGDALALVMHASIGAPAVDSKGAKSLGFVATLHADGTVYLWARQGRCEYASFRRIKLVPARAVDVHTTTDVSRFSFSSPGGVRFVGQRLIVWLTTRDTLGNGSVETFGLDFTVGERDSLLFHQTKDSRVGPVSQLSHFVHHEDSLACFESTPSPFDVLEDVVPKKVWHFNLELRTWLGLGCVSSKTASLRTEPVKSVLKSVKRLRKERMALRVTDGSKRTLFDLKKILDVSL